MSGSEQSLRRGQVTTFLLVWVAYCSTYLLRKPLGVVKTDLGRDLGLSKAQLGWCDTSFALPYALMQILLPSLTSRHGPRSVLTSCLASAGLVTCLTYSGPLSTGLPGLCLGLALTGALLAPAWPACVAAVSSWFPDSRLNTIFGFINTSTFCGGLAGTTLAAAITEYSGWRSVGFYPALIASLSALLVSMFLFSPEEKSLSVPGKVSKAAENKTEGHDDSLLEISRIPGVRHLAAGMFSLKFVRYAMTMWLPLYLLEHLGYSKLQAGIFSTVFDIGGIIGAPVFGLLLDRYYADRPLLGVILTMALGSLVTLLFIITASWGMVINLSCLLVVGAANCGPDAILSGSESFKLGETGGEGRGGAVTSFVNGVGNCGSIVEGPLIGLLLTLTGWEGVLGSFVGVNTIGALILYQGYTTRIKPGLLPS